MPDAVPHPSIVALVSLAANIASNHPKQGLCQIQRLRGYGISEEQIALAIDITRHIRDEAGEMLDRTFDDEAAVVAAAWPPAEPPAPTIEAMPETACCTPTAKGNAWC